MAILVQRLYFDTGTRPVKEAAHELGMEEREVSSIARLVSERHKKNLHGVFKGGDAEMHVFLSDRPNQAFGIIISVKKVNGRWEEASQVGEWMI